MADAGCSTVSVTESNKCHTETVKEKSRITETETETEKKTQDKETVTRTETVVTPEKVTETEVREEGEKSSSSEEEEEEQDSSYDSEKAEAAERVVLEANLTANMSYANVSTACPSTGVRSVATIQSSWLFPKKKPYTHVYYPPKKFWSTKAYNRCLADPLQIPSEAGWVRHTLVKDFKIRYTVLEDAQTQEYFIVTEAPYGASETSDPGRKAARVESDRRYQQS